MKKEKHYYIKNFDEQQISAREELERDRKIINKFMEKYGEEWQKLGEH